MRINCISQCIGPAQKTKVLTPTEDLNPAQEIADFGRFSGVRHIYRNTSKVNNWLIGIGAATLVQFGWAINTLVDVTERFSGLKLIAVSSAVIMNLCYTIYQLILLPWLSIKVTKEITQVYHDTKKEMMSRYSEKELPLTLRNVDNGAWQTIRTGQESELSCFSSDSPELSHEQKLSDLGRYLVERYFSDRFSSAIGRLANLQIAAGVCMMLSMAFIADIPLIISEAKDDGLFNRNIAFLIASTAFYVSSMGLLANFVYNKLVNNITGACRNFRDYLYSIYDREEAPGDFRQIDEGLYQQFINRYEDFKQFLQNKNSK